MDLIRTLGVAIDAAKAKSGGAQASAAFADVGNKAEAAERKVRGAQGAIDRAGRSMSGGAASGRSFREMLNHTADSSNRAARSIHQTRSASDSLAAGFRSLKVAAAGLGLALIARDFLNTELAIQRVNNALRFASDGTAEFARNQAFARNVANQLGLEFNSSAREFSKFLAAGKGTQFRPDDLRNIYLGVSQAATVLTLSTEETAGVLNALQQMISKGTVQAEELRGQLGERLPGAFQIAARAMGVTTQQLGKMLEQGQVTAYDLLPKLAVELNKTFGPESVNASKSLNAEINRLKNSWTELKLVLLGEGGGGALFARVARDARAALEDTKVMFAGLIQAGKEGNLSEAVAASLRIGFGEAANYFGGFVKTASEMFAEVGKGAFTAEYFSALIRSFQSVAAAFGLALMEGLSKPLAYAQAWIESHAAGKDSDSSIRYQASLKAEQQLLQSDPRFKGLTVNQINGPFGKLGMKLTGNTAGIARQEAFYSARDSLAEDIARQMGAKTVAERAAAIMADGGPRFGFSGMGNSIGELKAANQSNMEAALSDLAKATAGLAGTATQTLRGFRPLNIVDTSADRSLIRGFASRSPAQQLKQPTIPQYVETTANQPRNQWQTLGDTLVKSGETIKTNTEALARMKTIGMGTASAIEGGFGSFTDSLVTDFDNIGKAFREMTAGILQDIAKIVLRQTVAQPIAGALISGIGSAFGGALSSPTPAAATVTGGGYGFNGTISAGTASFNGSFASYHTGGIVGQGGGLHKVVDPSIFIGAPRFHSGLRPDEFPAILQRGEEVVPKNEVGRREVAVSIPINVTVNGSDGGSSEQNQRFGKEIGKQLEAMVDMRVAHALRPQSLYRRSGR